MNKPLIIGIGFEKRSGKSTAANYLAARLGCQVYPLSKRLYDAAEVILGEPILEEDKTRSVYGGVTGRKFLQELGGFFDHLFGDDFIVNSSDGLAAMTDGKSVIIPDIRKHAEANAVRSRGGYLWRITRPGSATNDRHRTENEGLMIEWDAVIANDGTLEEFFAKIDQQLKELL